ncbi:hypothetical protein SPHINGOR109_40067 [Sphingorhabdus sp. 109]|nr:hypothetical protein SPHINGOR109_40067 [Sphingorhabdus sp. 109]
MSVGKQSLLTGADRRLFADQGQAAEEPLFQSLGETAADMAIPAPDCGRADRAAALEAEPDPAALGNDAVASDPATIDRDIDQLALSGTFAMLPDGRSLDLHRMAERLALFDQRRFHRAKLRVHVAHSHPPPRRTRGSGSTNG